MRAIAYALLALPGLALPQGALADGGLVRASQAAGALIITVFSAPTPLRAGPADISVLLQERTGGATVLDGEVQVTLRAAAAPFPVATAAATRAAAVNKLLYAALLDVPAAGRWEFVVDVKARSESHRVAFDADVAAAAPSALAFWPHLALPFIAVALYTVHQWRALRASPTGHGGRRSLRASAK
ncbi:MAG: hypothetical protein AB7V27_19540 [Candidatus Binatia bacterium]